MGVKQLHSHFICRNAFHKRDDRWIQNISNIPGSIGVDLSGLMHCKMGTVKGSAVFDMSPEVPLFDALAGVMKDLRFLKVTCGKDVTVFIDGRSHPMKGVEEANRELSRTEKKNELDEIYNAFCAGSYDDVKQLRRLIVHRREDLTVRIANECAKVGILVMQAPFEADWQLVEAQQAGLIDNILSQDGDILVLGGDNIISELNFHHGECCFYRRSEVLLRPTIGGGRYSSELPALSSFLGNDYIERQVRELMDDFVCLDDAGRREMITSSTDFSIKFWLSYHLQMYAPVFRINPSSEDVEINLLSPDTYITTVEPLHPLPDGMTQEEWGITIGFGCDPTMLLDGNFKSIFRFEVLPLNGVPVQLLQQPISQYEPHYKVAHGANPDTKIPLRFWSDWALITFLMERGLRLRGKYDRDNCLRLATRVLALMEELGSRAPQPQHCSGSSYMFLPGQPKQMARDRRLALVIFLH